MCSFRLGNHHCGRLVFQFVLVRKLLAENMFDRKSARTIPTSLIAL